METSDMRSKPQLIKRRLVVLQGEAFFGSGDESAVYRLRKATLRATLRNCDSFEPCICHRGFLIDLFFEVDMRLPV